MRKRSGLFQSHAAQSRPAGCDWLKPARTAHRGNTGALCRNCRPAALETRRRLARLRANIETELGQRLRGLQALAGAALALALAVALSGCESGVPASNGVLPPAAPSSAAGGLPVPPPLPSGSAASAASDTLRSYYAHVQANLLAQGLLRTDGGGPDTPFTDTMLARNFVQIALFNEYSPQGGSLAGIPSQAQLRRWERPVTFGLEFGPSVSADQRARDSAEVAGYAARLSRATGLPISTDPNGAGNFHVLFLSEDDRPGYAARIRQLAPGIDAASLRAILAPDRDTYCLVIAFTEGNGLAYTNAVALIRTEHPDLLRLSCIHEELAQGLGLANDSAGARPSIFNDDQEFGLLTTHDELLLKLLYDRRLRPGMSAAEAGPIVRAIAAELMGGAA